MCKIREMIRKAKSVLESKVGEGYIDTAVKMIIAVVIGGLAFLRSEYEIDNVGLILDGLKYAAAWDENGMTITRGDRVKGAGNTVFLSWEDVDRRIRQLLETGQYIPQDEAEKSAEIYENFVANKVADLYRDRFSEIPEIYKTQGRFLWPEITEFYKDILTTPEKLEPFISEVSDNIERAKEIPDVRRFYYGEELLYCLISQFRRDPIDFPQAEIEILPPKHFVTQDKIERALIGGSGVSEGKFRMQTQNRSKDTINRSYTTMRMLMRRWTLWSRQCLNNGGLQYGKRRNQKLRRDYELSVA